jgi:hypothetical protein
MRLVRLIATVFLLAILFASTAGSGAAQEATADATPGGPTEGYPVAIHEGSCDEPMTEPAWEIGNAVAVGVDQDEPDVIGSALTRTIAATSSELDFSLDSANETDYVIAIHASPEDQETVVACGQVTGIRAEGKLVVALAPVGESEVTGIAIFDEDTGGLLDLGEDQTQVTVYIVVPSDGDEATPPA